MGPPFEALVTCSLAHLSAKVFVLLAITSARRVSELQALMRPLYTIFFKDTVFMRLHPKCIPKMVSSIHLRQSTFFPKPLAHKDEKRLHTLDIHYTHSLYIVRTKSFRLAPCLFISWEDRMRGQEASAQRWSHWITSGITTNYEITNTLSLAKMLAHSTRAPASLPSWDICLQKTSVEQWSGHQCILFPRIVPLL